MKIILKMSLVLLLFMNMQCSSSKDKIHELSDAKKYNVEESLKKGVFQVVVDASTIKVRTLKDGKMPVKGTLNIKSGTLNINPKATNLLDIVVDMTSWDSGLTLRDQRILSVFFGTDYDKGKTATFQVSPIPQDKMNELRKNKKLDKVNIQGVLKYYDATVPVKTVLNVRFNEMGRMVVETVQPIQIKISDLGLTEKLKTLITICAHKSVDDIVALTVHMEFEPLPPS